MQEAPFVPTTGPAGSVVVAAHNEASRLAPLLKVLEQAARRGVVVAVVTNGCTDATVSLVERCQHIRTCNLVTASKTAALNAGEDLVGEVFPRLYIDADVSVSADEIETLLRAAARDGACMVAPLAREDIAGSSWAVQRFFAFQAALPAAREFFSGHLAGRGIYGTNARGRAKFDRFPDLRNDDRYFDLQFCERERVVVEEVIVSFPGPPTLRALVRRLVRVALGEAEIASMAPTTPGQSDVGHGGATDRLGRLWRRMRSDPWWGNLEFPSGVVDAAVYAGVWSVVRAELFRAQRSGSSRWR